MSTYFKKSKISELFSKAKNSGKKSGEHNINESKSYSDNEYHELLMRRYSNVFHAV